MNNYECVNYELRICGVTNIEVTFFVYLIFSKWIYPELRETLFNQFAVQSPERTIYVSDGSIPSKKIIEFIKP